MGLFSVPPCSGTLGEEMAFLIENLGRSKVDLFGSALPLLHFGTKLLAGIRGSLLLLNTKVLLGLSPSHSHVSKPALVQPYHTLGEVSQPYKLLPLITLISKKGGQRASPTTSLLISQCVLN